MAALLFAIALPRATQAGGVVFQDLGGLQGADGSIASAVSADGSVIVGSSFYRLAGTSVAWRWTAAGGIESFGGILGSPSYAYDLSSDGSVVVGQSSQTFGDLAFSWTQAGGLVTIGSNYSRANDVSADGSAVVGHNNFSGFRRAFGWTSDEGLIDLGTLPGDSESDADGVSADGLVVVGSSRRILNNVDYSYTDRAFRWTIAGGMQSLGTVAGESHSSASAANTDGSVIVGKGVYNGVERAFRWTQADGIKLLEGFGGHTWANDVSADGYVAVGSVGGRAVRWTGTGDVQDLNTLLPQMGVNLSGWTLTSANSISSDGKTIVGHGQLNGSISERAFVVFGLPTRTNIFLGLEKSDKLAGAWRAVNITADMVTQDGKLNIGVMTNTNEFYRLRIQAVTD